MVHGSARSAAVGPRSIRGSAVVDAGVVETMVSDVRLFVRELAGIKGQLSTICIDGRVLWAMPELGRRAGYDEAERRKRLQVKIAVDGL